MSKSVLQTIRAGMDSFSKGQKRIAAFILDNYDRAAFMTAAKLGQTDMVSCIRTLNRKVGIPETLSACIKDEAAFMAKLDEMAECAKADGCTKTNPIIPTPEQLKALFVKAYHG